ncbi:MAG: exo-beta-N-acetylmuramidase NamZ family protein [bacterium]
MQMGIDILTAHQFERLRDKKIALLTHIPATDSKLISTISHFTNSKTVDTKLILSPEHGLFSAMQDQVFIKNHQQKSIPVVSLYGRELCPPLKILKTIDIAIIDLVDIGVRYYTFIWTAILLIKAMAELHKKVLILDRPNPLNGATVQGPVLEKEFSSFVGLYPLPVRHGMTIGEICNMINRKYKIDCDLEVIKMEGWKRSYCFTDCQRFWTIPSPNMPSFDTSVVYPGMCLLEGTNVSEGRGTTRPFEIFGAPWIDEEELVRELRKIDISGVRFRPLKFIPTFHKYKGKLCGGVQIYVDNIKSFDPVVLGLEIIRLIKMLYPKNFAWRMPPYEFEKKRLPFDILIGNSWIREAIERGDSVSSMKKRWQRELNDFIHTRRKYLLYD